MRRAAVLRLTLLAAVAGAAAFPAGALALPPSNDGYLQSIAINKPGTTLTEEQVKDVENTREATVQPDLFAPPGGGGGAERTDCRGTVFGATVWYDFHPHADGTVRVQATGFDAALGVYEFDAMSSRLGARVDCINTPDPSSEELFLKVKRGKSYTVQVGGGVAAPGGVPATGDLSFTFEYLADTDGDGTLDALDKCPDTPGTASGCPQVLAVVPKLRAIPTPGGIRVSSLSVAAPHGARVRVRCRRGCSFTQTRTAAAGAVRFGGLSSRQLPVGARLEIFVTKARSIGSYTAYVITRGNFKRTDRCLRPGSQTPRKTCK